MHHAPFRPRHASAALLALIAITAIALAACSSSAAPTASDPNAQGSALVDQFFTILSRPSQAKADQLKTFLTPEFQVVRANGDQQGKDAYLQNPPSVASYTISDLVGTQSGELLVVSYKVITEETVSGVKQSTTAPRLSVFRWVDGGWHLAAHANFGALTQ